MAHARRRRRAYPSNTLESLSVFLFCPPRIGNYSVSVGNGWGTRTSLLADPHSSNPSVDRWFDTDSFAVLPLYLFGNSGMGTLDGPGAHIFDFGLMKNFRVTGK